MEFNNLLVISADAFNSVGKDVDGLMGFQQPFDLRPATSEQGVIFTSAEIAEPQMHHPWRRRLCDYPVRKICILAAKSASRSDSYRP